LEATGGKEEILVKAGTEKKGIAGQKKKGDMNRERRLSKAVKERGRRKKMEERKGDTVKKKIQTPKR